MTARWRRLPHRPLVLGHRGSPRRVTENTIASFELALDEGADGVELDVRLCGTGEPVVFHDEDLVRLANRPDRIEDLPWGDVRDVRLTGGGRIPLLAHVLEALGPETLVNVELKVERARQAAHLVGTVAAVLATDRDPERFVVSSFHPRALWELRRQASTLLAGQLFAEEQAWALREAVAADLLRPFAVHPEHVLVTPRRLARWQRLGFAVHVWTVDDPHRARTLSRMGVGALITNTPATLRTALELHLAEDEDLAEGVARLRDPLDPVLDWDEVRAGLLAEDQDKR